jgi:hypothetical protein
MNLARLSVNRDPSTPFLKFREVRVHGNRGTHLYRFSALVNLQSDVD